MDGEPEHWPRPECRRSTVPTTKGPVDSLEFGRGWPILYFHGTGAGADIVPVMEHALIEDGFRVIVPNRPGYNGTPLSCGQTPEAHADLAAEVLDQLGLRRVAVIGTSGGGVAAPMFAARHPERTVALVLQCALCHPFASTRWMPPRQRRLYPLFRWQRAFLPILRYGFRREMRKLSRDPNRVLIDMCGVRAPALRGDPRAQQFVRFIADAELRCAQQPAGIENDWANVVGEKWLRPEAVTCPTLILHDRADPLVPLAQLEWALKCIPHAAHCDLHAGGHLIWIGRDEARMRDERARFLRRRFEESASTSGSA